MHDSILSLILANITIMRPLYESDMIWHPPLEIGFHHRIFNFRLMFYPNLTKDHYNDLLFVKFLWLFPYHEIYLSIGMVVMAPRVNYVLAALIIANGNLMWLKNFFAHAIKLNNPIKPNPRWKSLFKGHAFVYRHADKKIVLNDLFHSQKKSDMHL